MSEPRTAAKALLAEGGSVYGRVAAAKAWLDGNLRVAPRAAKDLVERLLPEAEEAGDSQGVAWLRFHLGWLFIDADDYERGSAIIESAKSAFEDAGDGEGLSRCLNALGFATFMMGVHDLALDFFREAVDEAKEASRPDLAGAAYVNMAECLYELEAPDEALHLLEECRREYPVAPHNIASFQGLSGKVYRTLGRLEEAERELLKALDSAGGALHDSLEVRQVLADVYIDAGRLEEAEPLVGRGIAECARAGERLLGTRFRLSRARMETLRNRTERAISELEAALRTAREIGAHKVETDAEKALYLVWEARGEYRKALDAFVRHSELKDAMRSEQTLRRIEALHDERSRREARHFESLYRQISAVSEIGRRITASLDLDVSLETLYSAVNGLMDAPTLMIALVDAESRSLDYRLFVVRGERKEGFVCPLDEENFGCWCVRHGRDVVIGDIEAEYRRYVSSYEDLVVDGTAEKSLVFIPLLAGGRVVGMFSVQSHIPHAYDRRKVEVLHAIGSYIAIAIENAGLFRRIRELAVTDALTGLSNRRRITEATEEAFRKAQRYELPTGFILLDLDHFKQINDTYGHDSGDAVLQILAKALSGQIRDCDLLGRFGGEEFVVLLPETGVEGARLLAERLRRTIEALEIVLPDGGTLRVTASFGVSAVLPGDGEGRAALKRADRALYRAKNSGRNGVAVEPVA